MRNLKFTLNRNERNLKQTGHINSQRWTKTSLIDECVSKSIRTHIDQHNWVIFGLCDANRMERKKRNKIYLFDTKPKWQRENKRKFHHPKRKISVEENEKCHRKSGKLETDKDIKEKDLQVTRHTRVEEKCVCVCVVFVERNWWLLHGRKVVIK